MLEKTLKAHKPKSPTNKKEKLDDTESIVGRSVRDNMVGNGVLADITETPSVSLNTIFSTILLNLKDNQILTLSKLVTKVNSAFTSSGKTLNQNYNRSSNSIMVIYYPNCSYYQILRL